MPIDVFSQLPAGLLEVPAAELTRVLNRPTLLHLDGQREPELFVSVLLHGTETSGWDGVRRYLSDHSVPGRSLSLFVGNVDAAARELRVLPGQQDYNRIWRGATGKEGEIADAVMHAIAERTYFAAVDLHNNTGHNPYYSVITEVTPANLGLAYLFSDKAVYIREPDTTMTQAFTGRCPAVTLEVGPTGDARCADRVYDFLDRCMDLSEVPRAGAAEVSLFESLARVHVVEGVDFHFAGEDEESPATLTLTGGVEAVNFHELPAGTRFGAAAATLAQTLKVLDAEHRDVTTEFFEQSGSEIVLKRPIVPAMYTTDPYVVRQDCLCYFMRRLEA